MKSGSDIICWDENHVIKKLNRVLFYFIYILITIVFCLTLCIYNLFPLKEKQPWVVTFDNKVDSVVSIDKINTNSESIKRIKEGLSRRYVLLRETINSENVRDHLDEIKIMSSDTVWHDFMEQMKINQEASVYDYFKNINIVRKISITGSSFNSDKQTTCSVMWKSTDYKDDKEVSTKEYISIIESSFSDEVLKKDTSIYNPTGYICLNYFVKVR